MVGATVTRGTRPAPRRSGVFAGAVIASGATHVANGDRRTDGLEGGRQ